MELKLYQNIKLQLFQLIIYPKPQIGLKKSTTIFEIISFLKLKTLDKMDFGKMLDRKAFEGVWVQTITPIGEKEDILLTTITKQYEHLSKSNITGIIPFGPVGEFPSLTLVS